MSLAATTLLCWQSTANILQIGISAASEWGHTMSYSFLHMVKRIRKYILISFMSFTLLFLFITAKLKISTLPEGLLCGVGHGRQIRPS
jgi:hypothetical protein